MILLAGPVRDVESLLFMPECALLAAGGGGEPVQFWSLAGPTQGPIWRLNFKGRGHVLRGHPDSRHVHGPGLLGVLPMFDPAAGSQIMLSGFGGWTDGVAWGPSGQWCVFSLAEASLRRGVVAPGGRVVPAWRVSPFGKGRVNGRVVGLTVLPHGQRLVTLEDIWGRGGRVVLRSADSGERLASSVIPAGPPAELAVTPDGENVAVRAGAALYVWPALDVGRRPVKVSNSSRKHYTGIAFHPSGRFLAATSNDATVKLYDTGTWQVAKMYSWEIGRLRSVAFSPDGTLAAAGSDLGKIVVWDVDL